MPLSVTSGFSVAQVMAMILNKSVRQHLGQDCILATMFTTTIYFKTDVVKIYFPGHSI